MDFFSGQKPINPQMGQIESDSIREEQTKRCLDNISGVLAVADHPLIEMNGIYGAIFITMNS
jgi:enamine deaminase RidA (YjgF/YER057c/UK114 family)